MLSASSYGCTKVKIEFWSQCLILLLYSIFLVEAIPSFQLLPHALLGSTNHIFTTFSCFTLDARRQGRNWKDGISDQNKRVQGLNGNCHEVKRLDELNETMIWQFTICSRPQKKWQCKKNVFTKFWKFSKNSKSKLVQK